MLRAVAYVRVSTDEQDPENQVRYLKEWANRKNIEIVRFYVDKGVSGAIPPWERPAFRQMLEEVRALNVQLLVVFEVSRLVRNFSDLYKLLDIVEGELGLAVVSASEKEEMLNKLDPLYRQFLRQVLAFVATMEREFIRQRTRAAMERARAEGKVGSLADVEEFVEKAVQLKRAGHTLGEIARELGVSTYLVRRALSKAGQYAADGACPRCFRKLEVEKYVREVGGKYVVFEKRRCPNCGYEEEVEVGKKGGG